MKYKFAALRHKIRIIIYKNQGIVALELTIMAQKNFSVMGLKLVV